MTKFFWCMRSQNIGQVELNVGRIRRLFNGSMEYVSIGVQNVLPDTNMRIIIYFVRARVQRVNGFVILANRFVCR